MNELDRLHDEARPLDIAFSRWVRQRSGSELLGRAALAVSVAEGQGHACAGLNDDPTLVGDVEALRAHAWVGDGNVATPFVLDHAARMYTLRNWRHEQLLAEALLARARVQPPAPDARAVQADVAELFAGEDARATRWQRAAVVVAPVSRLLVLTGGPGTGKTSTALRLLLVLLRHAVACGLPEHPSIALAAPTGKAAQRLAQAIATGKQRLRERLAPQSRFQTLLEQIPHADAATLHRLLGYRPAENTFARGARDPLAADIVLVDEASMVDLALMRTLAVALRPEAILVLLGDPAQLAAVEAGSVLSDVVASVPENAIPPALAGRLEGIVAEPAQDAAPTPFAGHVITLTHGWRAQAGLQHALTSLRAGDTNWLDALLARQQHDGVEWHNATDAATLRTRVTAWVETHADTYARIVRAQSPTHGLAALRDLQLLCALREGTFGTQGINAAIEQELRRRLDVATDQAWYHGRPVLILRNDYARDLYNGDLGIALDGPDGPRVWFETGERDGSTGLRSFSPRALPEIETAWAITIHRSQGSEYGAVAVVLPPDPAHRILSRELLYTAVSRATHHIEIWSTPAALRAAAARPLRRFGGLRDRLR
jgi:exodeoxyribonuclease V alpha subunit